MSERDDTRRGQPPHPEDAAQAEIEGLLAELDADDLAADDVPPEVWAGIEAGLAEDPDADSGTAATSLDAEPARRRRRALVWVGAVAAAVALAVATVVVVGDPSGDSADDLAVLSTAELGFDPATFDPLGAGAAAEAQLVDVDGRLELRLVDATLPDLGDEDLELWLIQPDGDGNPVDVASVAVLSDAGRYVLPAGLDPSTHFVVDISVEPRDGDAAHSGRSILRGPLEDT